MGVKKKIILFFASALILIFAVGHFLMREYSIYGNKIISINFNDDVFHAEVVSSNEKLERGLGQRSGLCDSCAMLFDFQGTGKYSFWMKDMKIPIDIIWVKEGKVVQLEKNIQPNFKGILKPESDADAVLEINAGKSDELRLRVGDSLIFQ